MAQSAGPGAEGLLFLPYLFGERTPYWNPNAKGMIFGLAPHHTKAHIARASIEGVTMCMAHIFELLRGSPGGIKEIRASGGFARSDVWVQIFADIVGHPVMLPATRENSAMGAAILAMKATGRIKSLAEADQLIKVRKVFKPDPGKTRFYKARYQMFKDLYDHLESDFAQWAAITAK
jgi:gluconokinase